MVGVSSISTVRYSI